MTNARLPVRFHSLAYAGYQKGVQGLQAELLRFVSRQGLRKQRSQVLCASRFDKLRRYRTPHRSASDRTDETVTLTTPLSDPAAAIRRFLVLHACITNADPRRLYALLLPSSVAPAPATGKYRSFAARRRPDERA